jgi:FkbM family methyltransferase
MTTISLRNKQQQQQQWSRFNYSIFCSHAIAFLQLALVVLAGGCCGFVVAALQALSYGGGGFGGGDFENGATTSTRSLSSSSSNIGNSNNNNCQLPPKTTKMTLASNDVYFDLVVWDDGDFLTETIKNTGVWEILNIQGVAELGDTTLPTRPGTVFWDIGANVGYYSFLFAAAGYTVVAVEPESQNAELFRTSLCLNPNLASRMTLLQTAVSSPEIVNDFTSSRKNNNKKCRVVATTKAKRMKQYLHLIPRLVCDDDNSGKRCRRAPDTICQDFTVTTLDSMMKSYTPPHVLKLDVEGHELAVFKGGAKLLSLSSSPSIIQYENRDTRIEADIAKLLESHGYTIGSQRGHDSNTVASKRTAATTSV